MCHSGRAKLYAGAVSSRIARSLSNRTYIDGLAALSVTARDAFIRQRRAGVRLGEPLLLPYLPQLKALTNSLSPLCRPPRADLLSVYTFLPRSARLVAHSSTSLILSNVVSARPTLTNSSLRSDSSLSRHSAETKEEASQGGSGRPRVGEPRHTGEASKDVQ